MKDDDGFIAVPKMASRRITDDHQQTNSSTSGTSIDDDDPIVEMVKPIIQ